LSNKIVVPALNMGTAIAPLALPAGRVPPGNRLSKKDHDRNERFSIIGPSKFACLTE
jgi:hypothetical protein